MTDNKNVSPVGWYISSYIIRFIELNSNDNEDLEKRFLAWENTILIQASDLDDAYDKAVAEAMLHTKPYQGGSEGVPVQWFFEGITELLPVYEALEHGSELMFREHHPKKLKNLRKLIRPKGSFAQ